MVYVGMLTAFIAAIVLTPIVIRLSYRIGAVDKPNYRKVHVITMPRIGGLAIFGAFLIGYFVASPSDEHALGIMLGAGLIILTGFLDDMIDITPKAKLVGQIGGALLAILWGGLQIQFINLPFFGQVEFGWLSIPITLIWIVGITNAINLIDGLDGLASGVSAIALVTMSIMAVIMGNIFVAVTAAVLAASILGFLFYNFHPAKIFMGDTGSLFLGYMISVLALLGFKNVAVISLIIPIIMLGVPISDTFFAIIRRLRMNQPVFAPDKSHLHHCLLRVGFSHRQTVLIIYCIAMLFGIAAILFSQATVWGGILLLVVLIIAIELFVEVIGLAGANYKPLINFVRMIGK